MRHPRKTRMRLISALLIAVGSTLFASRWVSRPGGQVLKILKVNREKADKRTEDARAAERCTCRLGQRLPWPRFMAQAAL